MKTSAIVAAWNRMWSRSPRYRYIHVGSSTRRDVLVEVGLNSESGLYPPVDLVFTSVAEIRELANTLRGVADAEARKRKGLMTQKKWTVVQHSGHTKPGFAKGLEEAQLSTAIEVRRVQSVGGLVFDDYKAASDYTETEMYPPSVTGLHPNAPGTFSSKEVGRRRIYIPVKK